jgi:hypothetical protein
LQEPGRTFREAWIAGVHRHFPGEPKPGYVTPWEEMPEWERMAAARVENQVVAFWETSLGRTSKLTREQRGRFIAICWIAQMHLLLPNPKPSYVADWADLPEWQRETNCDIFDHIEQVLV